MKKKLLLILTLVASLVMMACVSSFADDEDYGWSEYALGYNYDNGENWTPLTWNDSFTFVLDTAESKTVYFHFLEFKYDGNGDLVEVVPVAGEDTYNDAIFVGNYTTKDDATGEATLVLEPQGEPDTVCVGWSSNDGSGGLWDFTVLPKTASDGWHSQYYYEDGALVSGWKKIEGDWYYFDEEEYYSVCSTGYLINGKVYLFDDDGIWVQGNGWKKLSWTYEYDDEIQEYVDWYYLQNDVCKTGWMKLGGKWYYFDPEYGYMYNDGNYEINGKVYCFAASGALIEKKAAWVKKEWEYEDGVFVSWYYRLADGTLATGWKKIGGKWYYFGEYGDMYNDGVLSINNKNYAFNKDGSLAIGWYKQVWEDEEGDTYTSWYYGTINGVALGWKKISGKWYYFDPGWGSMYSDGNWDIDGVVYLFDKNGALATGWYSYTYEDPESGDEVTVWNYYTSSGRVEEAWKKISGKWYYFGEGGYMYNDGRMEVGGTMYAFDKSGALHIGWYEAPAYNEEGDIIGTIWFYSTTSGIKRSSWIYEGGYFYYVDEYGVMMQDAEYVDEDAGMVYTFDEKGHLINSQPYEL